MRKCMLFFILVIVFTLSFVSALCTDSDGGKNIYENGEVHYVSPNAQPGDGGTYAYDVCYDGVLHERFCEEGAAMGSEPMECPDGYKCWIDKCIEENEEYVPDINNDGDEDTASSAGGSGGGSGSCPEFFICDDGTKVEYCETVVTVTGGDCIASGSGGSGSGTVCSGTTTTSECVCIEDPESLCPPDEEVPETEPKEDPSEEPPVLPPSCLGCQVDDQCFPLGYRKSSDYCGEEGTMVDQKEGGEFCENSFECDSNSCIDDECIKKGFWKRVASFFSRLFGGE